MKKVNLVTKLTVSLQDLKSVLVQTLLQTASVLLFQFYEQFDDDEIGALDNAELEGFIEPDSARLEEVIKDYFIQKEKE